MKLIIAGGRGFDDYGILEKELNFYLLGVNLENVTIISGGQKTINPDGSDYGTDYLGELYARDKRIKLERYPAEWHRHGKKAGFLRNLQMAEVATHLVAFWNGESKGTKHMIDTMKKLNKPVFIIHYEGES